MDYRPDCNCEKSEYFKANLKVEGLEVRGRQTGACSDRYKIKVSYCNRLTGKGGNESF